MTEHQDFPPALWAENLDELDREIARLALVCQVRILDPGIILRVLRKDASVCGTDNPRRSQSCTSCSCCTSRYAKSRRGAGTGEDDGDRGLRRRAAEEVLPGPGRVAAGVRWVRPSADLSLTTRSVASGYAVPISSDHREHLSRHRISLRCNRGAAVRVQAGPARSRGASVGSHRGDPLRQGRRKRTATPARCRRVTRSTRRFASAARSWRARSTSARPCAKATCWRCSTRPITGSPRKRRGSSRSPPRRRRDRPSRIGGGTRTLIGDGAVSTSDDEQTRTGAVGARRRPRPRRGNSSSPATG